MDPPVSGMDLPEPAVGRRSADSYHRGAYAL
jgi:hypothetical protein